ncbi:hypothetical protein FRC09_007250 [Ceratobasidium sp. 395]|nr:hypothetical protein FRC09_007250 [Ceratobasidium sp. 395]
MPISYSDDMIRFRFHAQYIKYFGTFGNNEVEVYNWDSLAQISAKVELLPNLATISCRPCDLDVIFIFLSRSTQEISITEVLCPISSARLVERAACISPGICTLRLYPQPLDPFLTLDLDLDQLPLVVRGYASISKFSNLRALMSTPAMLEPPILRLIAQLPNLSSLIISPYQRGIYFDFSLSTRLPEDSFPALNVLRIPFTTSHDIKKFWELIPLAKLKSLFLDIESVSNDDSLAFISTLCQASHLITRLELTFPYIDDEDEGDEPYAIEEGGFEYLLGLSLGNSFSLRHAMFEFDGAWARIADSWKGLTHIDCIHQPTSLDDLMLLSLSLPKLKSVRCDFDLEGAVRSVKRDWMPIGTLPFYPCLEELIFKQFKLVKVTASDKYNLSDLARFMAYFWPNLSAESLQEGSYGLFAVNDGSERVRDLMETYRLFKLLRELIRAYVCFFHNRSPVRSA